MKISIRDFSCRAGHFDPAIASGVTRGFWTNTAKTHQFILIERDTRVTVGEEEISLPAGSLLYIRPEETYQVKLPCSAYYVLLDVEPDVREMYFDAWPRAIVLCDAERCAVLMRDVAMAEQENNARRLIAALMHLSELLEQERRIRETATRVPTEKTMKTIRLALSYMEEHFREKCTLNDVAAHVGRSTIYFHDTFEEVTGVSPYEYITRLRLEEAKRMLAFTDEEPADIAVQCGYGSQSYFNYVFKKALGITPLAYRRENNAGAELK